MKLRYQEEPPPDSLAQFVQACWTFTAPESQHERAFFLPPDGSFSIAVVVGDPTTSTVVVGPHARPLSVAIGPGVCVRGVRIRPEAAVSAFDKPVARWAEQGAPLCLVAPKLAGHIAPARSVDVAFDQLLDGLVEQALEWDPPDRMIQRAATTIEARSGSVRITDLARDLGLGVRTLQRRFLATTGLAPKRYARIRRFLLAAAQHVLQTEPEAWARIALEHGFADQAHFARECTRLTGVSPTAFTALMDEIEHIDVQP